MIKGVINSINMFNNYTKKEKFLISLLLVLVLLTVSTMLQNSVEKRRLKKLYQTEIDSKKKQYLKEISEKNKRIEMLLSDNKKQQDIISKAEKSIDSLENVKSKIQVKYKWKYKEIEVMNTEQIKNYWKNEFKN